MMGPTHRLFGALCGATMASATGADTSTMLMTALVATATAHGWSSPDLDQLAGWRKVSGRLPARLRAWTGHRRVTHWWGLPALLAFLVVPTLPAETRWPAVALLCGWASHLIGDAIFGEVPVFPWGGSYIGLGLETGGFIETGKAKLWGRERLVVPFGPTKVLITLALVWVVAGYPGQDTLRDAWELTATAGGSR